jgi:hypothetical protein
MKILFYAVGVIATLESTCASAQGPASAGPTPDFSGVYVGSPHIVQPDVYPLTPNGKSVQDVFDPLAVGPWAHDDCAVENFPALLWAGTVSNMQLIPQDGRIEIRYEHSGAIRTVQMDDVPPPNEEHTALGFSRGRWDGGALVIETTRLTGGIIHLDWGYPVSPDARIIERYSRSTGRNLLLELVVEDPVNYTEPVTIQREWLWAPDETLRPWNCVSLGPRDAEPDIDEIRRRINEL